MDSAPLDPALSAWLATLDADAREFFEERAAIVEYEAHQPRAQAHAVARVLTLAYLKRREEAHDSP